MTDEEIAKLFPKLAGLPLPPRPPDQPVDKAIQKADVRTDPALVKRFGTERAGRGPVIWDDQGQPVKLEEEIPE